MYLINAGINAWSVHHAEGYCELLNDPLDTVATLRRACSTSILADVEGLWRFKMFPECYEQQSAVAPVLQSNSAGVRYACATSLGERKLDAEQWDHVYKYRVRQVCILDEAVSASSF